MSAATDAAAAQARILAVIRAIPRGQVMGYGEVAAKAGLPGRARLVARLLGGNDDRTLPWHRVLRSDGRIALPEGSAGWREQAQRLRGWGCHHTQLLTDVDAPELVVPLPHGMGT